MSARYDVEFSDHSNGYEFITSSGDTYFAYFTEFILTSPTGKDIPIVSFGFSCRRYNPNLKHRHDKKVKATILYLIEEFFRKNGEEAILYLCMNNDGKARNKHITFGRWFEGLGINYDRIQYSKNDLYSSILVMKSNPKKLELFDAFNYTIEIYWGLQNQ